MSNYFYRIVGDCGSSQGTSDEITGYYFTNKRQCQLSGNREARKMSKFYGEDFTAVVEVLEAAE